MIYLLFSILFSTTLFVVFKYFGIYKIDVLKAIVVNYGVAFLMGFLLTDKKIPIEQIYIQPWFFGALILAALFIGIFLVMALTAQQNGVSVASIASKMSVIIPVFAGVFLYNETISLFQIIGVVISLFAVYLAAFKKGNSMAKKNMLYPVIVFVGSGFIDAFLKFLQINYVQADEVAIFSGSIFGIAALFGVLVLVSKSYKKVVYFGYKNIIAGILLGVPNYFSIVFLMKALQIKNIESAVLFTINNVAIVVLSSVLGWLLFKEKFSVKNKIGILLAVLGIVLVSIA